MSASNFGQCRNCGKPVAALNGVTRSGRKIPMLYEVGGVSGIHKCPGSELQLGVTNRNFKRK